MRGALRVALWAGAVAGIFLAFGWPLVLGPDPSSEPFHFAAIATLLVWLGSIAALLVMKH